MHTLESGISQSCQGYWYVIEDCKILYPAYAALNMNSQCCNFSPLKCFLGLKLTSSLKEGWNVETHTNLFQVAANQETTISHD